jgi:putative membrane protein
MAMYRTELALDRTTLAWVRTSLAMASFGFGMVAFFRSLEEQAPGSRSLRLHQDAIKMGAALIFLGVVTTAFAGKAHWTAIHKIRRGESPALGRWPLVLTLVILSGLLGLAGLWELFAR